eukprot:PhF_6_TR37134/c1_g1_i3/m.54633
MTLQSILVFFWLGLFLPQHIFVCASQASLLFGTGTPDVNAYGVGNGISASVNPTGISATFIQGLWFNFVNDAMYYTELNSCTIRQMAYFKGVVSVFAGQTGTCSDGSANANPTATTINTCAGGVFVSFGVTDKQSYVCDRGSHRIRAFDHVNGG